jgi:hypothetical protein
MQIICFNPMHGQQCAVSGFLAALANFMRQSDDRWVAE